MEMERKNKYFIENNLFKCLLFSFIFHFVLCFLGIYLRRKFVSQMGKTIKKMCKNTLLNYREKQRKVG